MPGKLECLNRRAGRTRAGTNAALLFGAALLLGLGWIVHSHQHRYHQLAEKVFHLKDGRFCYKQHDTSASSDTWYWLCNDSGSYYRSPAQLGSRMPARTAWLSSRERSDLERNPSPEEEEEIEQEEIGQTSGAAEEEVTENETDEPASVAEGGTSASSDESSGESSGGGGDSDGDSGGDSGGGGDD